LPQKNILNGVICPTITFFNHNFEVNVELNSLLFRHVLLNGAKAIYLLGTTGEGIYFANKLEEKIKLVNMAYDITEEKIPILLGIFGNDPSELVNEIEHFGKKFKNLSFILPPPYLRTIDDVGLKIYYQGILETINLSNKIILYHNPKLFANNNISPDLLKELVEYPNLIGIKDSSEKFGNYKGYIEYLNEDFTVCCGKERKFSYFLQLIPQELRKYSCLIPSISNIVNLCSKLYDAALEGDTLKIVQFQDELDEFREKLYDTQIKMGKQQRGLKYGFYSLYGDHLTTPLHDATIVAPDFQKPLEDYTKERIDATIRYVLNLNYIDRFYPISQKLFDFHKFKKIFSDIDELKGIGDLKRIKGPYGGRKNNIYRMKFDNDLVVRFHVSDEFTSSNICHEKILFPLLDKSLNKDTPDLRKKIKEIITSQRGNYLFNIQNPPIIPVGDLIFYDETREFFPAIYTIQKYIQGKPLFFHLQTQKNDILELEMLKFINFFKNLGQILGKLHEIKFDSYYGEIEDIGTSQAKKSYIDIFSKELNALVQEKKKLKVDFIKEINDYFKDNENLLEDEEPVLIHNDFQGKNIIVKEEPVKLNINGLINFDHWQIGSRAQDFVKLEYFTLDPLKLPELSQAFYHGYGGFYKEITSNDFKKKIEMHKLKWLIEELNYNPENLRVANEIKTLLNV